MRKLAKLRNTSSVLTRHLSFGAAQGLRRVYVCTQADSICIAFCITPTDGGGPVYEDFCDRDRIIIMPRVHRGAGEAKILRLSSDE